MKKKKESKEAVRKRVAAHRARKKAEQGVTAEENLTPELVTERVTPKENGVTQADINNLPPSLKFQLDNETRTRKMFHLPDNLKERQITMVRRFRGY